MALIDIDSLEPNPELGDYGHHLYHILIHKGASSLKGLTIGTGNSVLKNIGSQTISGVKTFSSSPLVIAPTNDADIANKMYADATASNAESGVTAGVTSQYYRGDKTWQTLGASVVGLGDVDNTSDLDKPVSTYLSTALSGKQDMILATTIDQYYRGDKTWQTLDKSSIGLTQVDNTSDIDKEISTLTHAALAEKQDSLGTGELFQYYRGDKIWTTLSSGSVGLGNVNNTSDSNRPISSNEELALTNKATQSESVLLTGDQTVAGIKTFSGSPKIGSSTVGYVWKATSDDGSGSWQAIGELVTTVDWSNITPSTLPATFPATIGPGPADAAAGNHTHTKSALNLGNVDNTSDANKPISTQTQTALNTKVANTRSINTSSHFSGGGTLASDKTLALQSESINISDVSENIKKNAICYYQTLGTREVGLNQMEDGFEFPYNANVISVKYRMGTADASGTTTVELRKNGSAIVGSSGTASLSPSTVTGSWSFSAGDKLTVYTTAIGATPGKRLIADIVFIKT